MKKWIKALIFILLFILVNEFLTLALKDDVFMRSNIDRCINNQYQDIFIGTSQCRRAVNPELIEEITGRSTTNASIPMSSPLDQYFLVKEICKRGNKPERIIYECDPYYFSEVKSGGHFYIYPMGINKIEYFLAGTKQDWRITIAPWTFQWSNYFRMGEVLQSKFDYFVKGRSGNQNGYQEGGDSFTPKTIVDRDFVVTENADEYVQKLISLCQDEGIELLIAQFPVSREVYDDMEPCYRWGADEYFKRLANEYGIVYVNFNDVGESDRKEKSFENEIGSFIDMEGHMRSDTSVLFSKDIGNLLTRWK